MIYDENGHAYIAENGNDFLGFEIAGIEPWKPGVKRIHAVNGGSNIKSLVMIFTKDSIWDEYLLLMQSNLDDLKKATLNVK